MKSEKVMPCERLGPTERVYQKLKTEIILQSFGLGGRLMVNELADRYLVSSTPVREALNRLYGEELIGFQHGKGYYCMTPSLQELEDYYDLLRVLLISCLKRGNAIEHDHAADENTTSYTDLLLLDLRDNHTNPSDDSIAIIRLIERIVALCGNMISLTIVKHIHARTHFILRRALSDAEISKELTICIGNLENAIRYQDRATQRSAVDEYHSLIKERLPILLGGFVSEQYLAAH